MVVRDFSYIHTQYDEIEVQVTVINKLGYHVSISQGKDIQGWTATGITQLDSPTDGYSYVSAYDPELQEALRLLKDKVIEHKVTYVRKQEEDKLASRKRISVDDL